MAARAARIALLLLGLLVSVTAGADTYDTHTLVSITVSDEWQTKLLYDCHVDIVGRQGDVYKALLTEDQLRDFWGRGFRIEILYDEMAEDRRLWREADEATASPEALAYYTASKFNTINPAAGHPHGAPAPAVQRPPGHLPALQPREPPRTAPTTSSP